MQMKSNTHKNKKIKKIGNAMPDLLIRTSHPITLSIKVIRGLLIIPTPMVSSCRLHFVDITNKGKNQSSQWILIMPTFPSLSYFVSTTLEGMLQACDAIKEK